MTPGERRPRFRSEFCAQAARLCSLGATDEDLAAFFGISQTRLAAWKQSHDEFRDAVRQNRDAADGQVERSLFERANGYRHPEDKVFSNGGKPVVVPTTKHYPPDPASIMFWLKNRQPAKWRDKIDHEVSGRGGRSITVEFIKVEDDG